MHESPSPLGSKRDIDAHISLPAQLSSVASGRQFVHDSLRAWSLTDCADVVALVASELITNAILHARSGPDVRLELRDGVIVLEVSDVGSGVPVRKHYGPDAATGRGILLVESLCSAWGARPEGRGKVVWCEFTPAMAAIMSETIAPRQRAGAGDR